MKKVTTILFLLILGLTVNTYSQAPAPADSFAGKWDITLLDTSQIPVWGFSIELTRKEDNLTAKTYHDNGRLTVTKVVEKPDNLVIHFDTPENERQGVQLKDFPLELTRVNDDNLKGNFMGSQVTAKRAK